MTLSASQYGNEVTMILTCEYQDDVERDDDASDAVGTDGSWHARTRRHHPTGVRQATANASHPSDSAAHSGRELNAPR